MQEFIEQTYSEYTEEDQKVWSVLFNRQMDNLPKMASDAFIQGLEKIKFGPDRIPDFKETNMHLGKCTGWQVVAVPGIVEDQTFFQLLSEKKFPATTWVRKMSELDYLEEPDMFHDVFGHIPLLTDQHFVGFLKKMGELGLKYLGNERAIDILSRIYWFTIEFGLIKESEGNRIYGAGILSSSGESKYSLSGAPQYFDFDVRKILHTTYRKDKFQEMYFFIDSYESLYNSIEEIEIVLEEMVSGELV